MIGLLRAELLRAWSRRVVRVLAIGVIVGIVVSMGIATFNGLRDSADARYQRTLEACLRGEFTPADSLPPRYHGSLAAYCPDHVRRGDFAGAQIRWADLPDGIASGTSSIIVLLGVLIGATLAGADWTAGTMGTLLTWEPRRTRVHLVRLLVAVAVVLVFTIGAQVFLVLAYRVAVAIAGTTDGTPPGIVGHLAGIISRVAAIAAVFAIVAHAVATLGRSTVAAVGILFGYLVVVEGFVAGLWRAIQPRLLIRAAEVAISQQPLLDQGVTAVRGPNGAIVGQFQSVVLSVSGAWVVLGVWVVVLSAVALLAFRARDVS